MATVAALVPDLDPVIPSGTPPEGRPVPAPGPSSGLYRLSVEQYEAMGRLGILSSKDRVHLIEGLLVRKMTKTPPHQVVLLNMNYAMVRGLPAGFVVMLESPVILARSVPEPDVMVLRGGPADFVKKTARPADTPLVIVIANTSYRDDRAQICLYAEAGITISWIVNIPAGRVEVYSDPTGPDPAPSYRKRDDFARGTRVPVVLDGAVAFELAVDDLLPPAD